MIWAAPYRDRVVHHALMNVLEPILDRHFHPDSYACRKGKGTHAAAERLQALMRRNRYVLQCDIRKFFPSLDHEALKAAFRRLIKDQRLLWLMDTIVDCSNEQERVREWYDGDELWTPVVRRHGLPIGNLTSQWFANWMLNGLDHHVTSRCGFGAYVRYCDDFLVLGDDKPSLWRAAEVIKEHVAGIRLQLHDERLAVRPVRHGVTFVGYRIRPTHRTVRKSNVKAFRRRLRWMQRAYADGRIEFQEVKQRLAGWMGHVRQATDRTLLTRESQSWVFTRGGAV
jgi:RNA-directed DNA polymerase